MASVGGWFLHAGVGRCWQVLAGVGVQVESDLILAFLSCQCSSYVSLCIRKRKTW